MAARVNTKVVVILVVALIGAGAFFVPLAYLRLRGNAERHARTAEEHKQAAVEAKAAGDMDKYGEELRLAKNFYARAVGKDPANKTYLRLMEESLLEIYPYSGDEAIELYRERLAVMAHEVTHFPGDSKAHLRFLRELCGGARITGFPYQWTTVGDAAKGMLDQVPQSDPAYPYGFLYRGMSQLAQIDLLEPMEITRAEEDLRRFVEAVPDSDEGWAALAQGQATIAAFLGVREHTLQGETDVINSDTMLERLDDTLRRGIERLPDGPRTATMLVQRLAGKRLLDPASVNEEELTQAIDHLVELAEESQEEPDVIARAANALKAVRVGDSPAQGIRLLQQHLERFPSALYHRFLLAKALYDERDYDEAEAVARAVLAAEPLPVSFLAQYERDINNQAASLIVDVKFSRWELTEEVDRPAALEALVTAREELASMVTNPDTDPLLTRADGKLAWAQGNFAEATRHFEDLIRVADDAADPQLLFMSARCLRNLNQRGRAHERLELGLQRIEQMGGRAPELLVEKAHLELDMRRFQEMRESLDRALEIDPENEQAQRLSEIADRELAKLAGERADPVTERIDEAVRIMTKGDLETARTTLRGLLEENPQDLRILLALFDVEVNADNKEQAQAYLDQALVIAPGHPRLEELKIFLAEDDPIERLRRYVQTLSEDPIEQVVQLHVYFSLFADRQRYLAEEREQEGDVAAATRARELGARARQEAENYLAEVLRVSPDHPALLESQFQQALLAGDMATAERIADRAKELNLDQANGLTYEGRLALTRGEYEVAIRAWEQSTALVPYSASAWAALATAYRLSGKIEEAEQAYEESYRCNPNDMKTVKDFVGLLLQVGKKDKKTRALMVLQNARLVAPDDKSIRDLWLALEVEIGDLPLVLRTRRRIYAEKTDDYVNAMRLAALLGKTEPRYDLLLDAEGNRRYTENSWNRLKPDEQNARLAQAREQWDQEADGIIEHLFEAQGPNLGLIRLQTHLLRLRGEAERGEQIFRDFIFGHDESEITSEMLTQFAFYQLECFKVQEALQTMEGARAYQDPARLEVDAALAGMLFRGKQWARALEIYEQVDAVAPSAAAKFRIVECLVKLRRLDEAQQHLTTALQETPEDYFSCMLQATILEGQAADAYAEGRREEAEGKYELYFAALEQAKRLRGDLHIPYLLKANSLLAAYRRSQGELDDRALLEDAMAELNRAESIRAGESEITLARAEVLIAMGDVRGAIGQLTDFLVAQPTHIRARKRLVELLQSERRWLTARNMILAGIEGASDLALWQEMLGDTYFQEARLSDRITPEAKDDLTRQAMEAYQEAYRLRRNLAMLTKLTDVSMAVSEPNFEGVVQMLEPMTAQLNTEPLLRILFAKALDRTGRRERALEQMREAYRQMRGRIAEGISPPATIAGWFQGLGHIFMPEQVTEAEAFVMDVCNNDLGMYEYHWLITLWKESGESGYDHTIELAERALAACPPDQPQMRAGIYQDLGECHLLREDWRAAEQAYSKVLEAMPDNVVILNDYAYLRAEFLDDPAGALPFIERASRLAPDSAAVLDTHGWVLFRLGDLDGARRYLQRAVLDGESPEKYLHMAHVLAARDLPGDLAEAERYLGRAREMQPDPRTQAEIELLADDIRTRKGSGG